MKEIFGKEMRTGRAKVFAAGLVGAGLPRIREAAVDSEGKPRVG